VAIIYVDDDDEITSAAARIRSSDEGPIGLVVPSGSRLATSRINFRLLAREAQSRGRRLAIVAGDAAVRALAVSAGLPVFGSVAEFESALVESGSAVGSAVPGPLPAVVPPPSVVAPPAVVPPIASAPPVPAKRPSARAAKADRARTDVEATTLFSAAEVASAAPAAPAMAPAPARAVAPAAPPLVPASVPPVAAPVEMPPSPEWPSAAGRGRADAFTSDTYSDRSRGRMAGAIVAAVIALALIVGGVAAYLLLPSASITVTPRAEALGPVSLTVRADPSIVSPDTAAGAVPAQRLTFDLAASDTFAVTGKRVAETKAKGRVTFRSYNTAAPNTIPANSIVSTEGGIQFRTLVAIRLGRAVVIPPSGIVPSSASVAIEAVKAGTAGNVPPNAITVVPRGEDPLVTSVRNVDATDGGTHQEIPRIDQADIEAATAQLKARLGDDFQTLLSDPGRAPAGSTLFAQTASLADPTFGVDPTMLLGQEVASFELAATSIGSVTAVDRGAVSALAAQVLQGRVAADHRMVEGSVDVRTDTATASGGVVMFPVIARGQQVLVLDAKALLGKIKGRPIFQARSILEPYGDVQIGVWPDWVTSIPTIDGRIELRVVESASPSSSPSPTSPRSPAP
jgi:hypothetical protein